MKLVETIPVGNVLGECVLWDERTSSLWWTDIEGRRLHRFDWNDRALHTYATPERLTAFGLVEGRDQLIAAFDCGLALFDPQTGTKGPCLKPEGLVAGTRMNDGRVDRQGRFWVGSMMEAESAAATGRLYCVASGRIETRERGIGIANGLGFSPDSRWCYFADSRQGVIWRYGFDAATGQLGSREVFARSQGGAVPDGAAVDGEGYVWSAQWGGGAVVRYAPDGRTDRVLEIPVLLPSCVAFGGPDLTMLCVTSARQGAGEAQTGAGNLFVYNAPVRGLPESRFKIDGWPGTAAPRR